MNDSTSAISAVLAKLAAYLPAGAIGVWAHVPADVQALTYLVLLDLATGVACGFKARSASSNTFGKGFRKKLTMGAIVGTAMILQGVGLPEVVRTAVVLAFIAQETLSIIENAGTLGVKLPGALAKRLTQLQGPLPSDGENTPGDGQTPGSDGR